MGFVWNALVDYCPTDRWYSGAMRLRLRRIFAHHASLPYPRKVYVGTRDGLSKVGEAEGKGRVLLASWSDRWKPYVSHFKGRRLFPVGRAQILNYYITRDDKNTQAGQDLSSRTYHSACRSGERTPKKLLWNNSRVLIRPQSVNADTIW